MTIRDFSRLCGCNPQTLRYYDSVGLLKPARVDSWTGYRFYDREQALTFVKIKNLQKAGFTIAEIKNLLDREDSEIFRAFEIKIAQAERRLSEIKQIQKSYQTEMTNMQKKLQEVRDAVRRSMERYDPTEEFGIDRDTYAKITELVDGVFEDLMAQEDAAVLEGPDAPEPQIEELLGDPACELVYENHGWKFVKDFFPQWSDLQAGREYSLLFRLAPGKANRTAFANTTLGMLCLLYPKNGMKWSCNTAESQDGLNHFWLLLRR